MGQQRIIYTLETLLARCDEVGECMEWTGYYNSTGHPFLRHDGAQWLARRLAYVLNGGHLPVGYVLANGCGNPRCILPAHSIKETKTTHLKNLSKTGRNSGMVRLANLAATHRARHARPGMTMELARALRTEPGTITDKAKRHNLPLKMVSKIVRGDAWKEYSHPFAGLLHPPQPRP